MRSMTVSMLPAIALTLLLCAPVLGQFGGGSGPLPEVTYAPPAVPAELFAMPRFGDSPVRIVPEYLQQTIPHREQRRAVLAKLEQRVTCQFSDTPLEEAIRKIERQLDMSIQINNRALEDIGLSTDVTVTMSLSQIRLRTALDVMLGELELTYLIDGNRIEITTPEDAEAELTTIFYPCSDLLYEVGGGLPDYDSLIQLLTTVVEPESWEELGGPGALQPISEGLVISQIDRIHGKLGQLFKALRQAKSLSSENYDPSPIEMGDLQTERERIEGQLGIEFADLQFHETPLHQVIDLMRQRTKVQFVIDHRALEDVGLASDVLVSGSWQLASAATVLQDVCSKRELTWIQRDDVLSVTTPAAAKRELTLKVYPVRDFVGSHGARGANTYFGGGAYSYGDLAETMTTTIEPNSWEELGGLGAVQPFAVSDSIVVSTTEAIQRKVDQLLHDVRARRHLPSNGEPANPPRTSSASMNTPPTSSARFTSGPVRSVTNDLVDQTYRVAGEINEQRLAEIAQRLRQRVSPGSWASGNAYILTLGTNQLVVRNSVSVQQSIRNELQRISAESATKPTTYSSTPDPFASDSPFAGDNPFSHNNSNASDDPFAGNGSSSNDNPFGP